MRILALRPAVADDIDFIVHLVEKTYKEQLIKTYGEFDLQKQRTWWQENLDPNFHQIIECDSQRAGLYAVSRIATEINLELMFLMPEFQGKSISGELLGDLIQEANQDGKQLVTRCLKYHDSAKQYWLHKGFTIDKVDEKRIYFKYSKN